MGLLLVHTYGRVPCAKLGMRNDVHTKGVCVDRNELHPLGTLRTVTQSLGTSTFVDGLLSGHRTAAVV